MRRPGKGGGSSPFELPLHVETRGPPAAEASETFVLLHGYGASSFSWRTWSPELARRGHVVLVDLKGSGSAPAPDDGRYRPRDQAELVGTLIRQRALRNVTLVGHSLGGGIALLATLLLRERGESDRIGRLVLVAGAAFPQRLPPFVRMARWPRSTLGLLRVAGPERVVGWVLRSVVHDRHRVTRGQILGYAGPLERSEVRRALLDVADCIVPDDLDSLVLRYPTVDLPTLLLWGRHDRVVPLTVGERLRKALPNARLEVLEECGHLPAEEAVDASLECLSAFLDGRPPVTSAPSAVTPEQPPPR